MGDSVAGEGLRNPNIISLSGRLMLAAMILLVVTVLFVIFLNIYARWFWRRQAAAAAASSESQLRTRIIFGSDRDSSLAPRRGLDPSVVRSLPVLVFREADFEGSLECAVCLCEIADGEKASLLPRCSHGFHVDCINMWFQSHSTCPLCRGLVSMDSGKEETRVPEATPANGRDPEPLNFPTNVLVWGTQDGVSTGGSSPPAEEGSSGPLSSSSSPSLAKLIRAEMAVIDIPRQHPETFTFTFPSSSSIGSSEEDLKSPTAATRLRSLKRFLGREKRPAAPSSSSPRTADVELGGLGGQISPRAFATPSDS